jgi:hypothetical protein
MPNILAIALSYNINYRTKKFLRSVKKQLKVCKVHKVESYKVESSVIERSATTKQSIKTMDCFSPAVFAMTKKDEMIKSNVIAKANPEAIQTHIHEFLMHLP